MTIIDFLAQNWWILVIACFVVWIAASAAKEAMMMRDADKQAKAWQGEIKSWNSPGVLPTPLSGGMSPDDPSQTIRIGGDLFTADQVYGSSTTSVGPILNPSWTFEDWYTKRAIQWQIRQREKNKPVTCSYCGVTTDQTSGTCSHCGAPL
jgi:hypothetical protein